jgi:hypothetical protein
MAGRSIMQSDERDRKIAKMLVIGVPQIQIAEVMGLSEGRISQIKEEEGFKRIYEECLIEDFRKHEDLNNGWDSIEKKALEIILSVLQYNKNPDYALKAAMVANRANRRGDGSANGNVPLPTNMGERVVIHLHQNFVGRLQQLNVEAIGAVDTQGKTLKDLIRANEKKQVSMLGPQAVKKLLTKKRGPDDEDLLADLDMEELMVAGDE